MRLLLACLSIASAALLNAETYKLSLAQPSAVCGKTLPAGDYKLEVAGEMAYFRSGNTAVEVPVQRQDAPEMAARTLIHYQIAGGMYRITEVLPKGSQIKLSFAQ